MVEIDFSTFPWTHPSVFTKLLLYTHSSRAILNARAVCQDWRNWIERESIWTKYLNIRKSRVNEDLRAITCDKFLKRAAAYRIKRLLESAEEEEETLSSVQCMRLAIRIEKCLRQIQSDLTPKFSQVTFRYTTELQDLDSGGIKAIGPISLFIRMKVKSGLVERILTEILSKYLTSIIVDKPEREKEKLRIYVMKTMSTGQNWVFSHFKPEPTLPDHAQVYSSLEEAQRVEISLRAENSDIVKSANSSENAASSSSEVGAESLKRKRNQSSEDLSKKPKLECEQESSMYCAEKKFTYKHFPTILELLDIDHPVVEEALKSKYRIDKKLVVPALGSLILQQNKYPDLLQTGLEIIGRDQEGKVSIINPEKDLMETDTAVVGYLENVNNFDVPMGHLQFWGGRDIRDRWSEFSKQLAAVDTGDSSENLLRTNRMKLPVIPMMSASSPAARAVEEAVATSNTKDLEALMAARGISITKK